jgi:hypothetical protein
MSQATEYQRDVLAIHFPHKISPLMRRMITDPGIVEVLTRIIGSDVKCMQSMLFVKNAGKPGQAWHQDETFIPTQDASLTGVWIAPALRRCRRILRLAGACRGRPRRGGARRRGGDDRDIVMVCGTDPYAGRGLEDLATPYLRPETVAR